jgi:hypothetical protein
MKKRIKRNRKKVTTPSAPAHYLTRITWSRLRRRGVRGLFDGIPMWSAVPYEEVRLGIAFSERVKDASKRHALFEEIRAAFEATVPAGFTLESEGGTRCEISFVGARAFTVARRAQAQALVNAFIRVSA